MWFTNLAEQVLMVGEAWLGGPITRNLLELAVPFAGLKAVHFACNWSTAV